jgi:hypothetical protein
MSPYSSKAKNNYLSPTNSSRVREKKKRADNSKKAEAKRICSVNCGKQHLPATPKKLIKKPI